MAVPPGVEPVSTAFERIEEAVRRGDTDLGRLGFWRVLAEVKADPAAAARWAEAAGRIDRLAFESRVRLRVPVWVGTSVLALGTIVGAAAVVVADSASSDLVAGLAVLFAGGVWSVTVHDLAHWLVGRLVGIRFTSCFLSLRPPPPRPGLKTDYASYLRTPPARRAWMHASGALATKAAPFAALVLAVAVGAPAWAAWGLAAMGAFEIATDVLFSVRSSDWKRVRRELGIARRHAVR